MHTLIVGVRHIFSEITGLHFLDTVGNRGVKIYIDISVRKHWVAIVISMCRGKL